MTVDLEWLYWPSTLFLIGASMTAIALAAQVLVRSRRSRRIKIFGRVVDSSRLRAMTLACLGVSGLLTATRDLTPASWQRPNLLVSLPFGLAAIVLVFTEVIVDQQAQRASNGDPEPRE